MRQSIGRNCSRCGKDDWYVRPNHSPGCSICQRASHRIAYRDWPADRKARYIVGQRERMKRPGMAARKRAYDSQRYPGRRMAVWESQYGLTVDQYHAMFESQGELCKLCREVLSPPHVDHDHKTGRVRGLLCGSCNRAVGLFKDNPAVLRKAAAYVEAV